MPPPTTRLRSTSRLAAWPISKGGNSSYLTTAATNLGGLTINNATVSGQGNVYFDALNGNSSAVYQNSGGWWLADGGAATICMGVNGGSGTFAGSIQDVGVQLVSVKQGAGVQVLAGNNTYTVAVTAITGGTLQIGNGTSGEFLASPSISIGSGAALVFNHSRRPDLLRRDRRRRCGGEDGRRHADSRRQHRPGRRPDRQRRRPGAQHPAKLWRGDGHQSRHPHRERRARRLAGYPGLSYHLDASNMPT